MKSKGKNKRWSTQEAEYIQQSLGKVTFEDMAAYLGRSPMSVRLFILRRRLTPGALIKRNLLMEMLRLRFRHPEDFAPTRAFYKETGIGQRRWWDLYYGRKPITGKEYAAVAEYLGLTILEAVESRQLEIFEEK